MKKLILNAVLAASAITSVAGSSTVLAKAAPAVEFDHTHAALTAIYEGVVSDGLVDYAALRAKPAALDRYLAANAATTPQEHAKWTKDQRLAFWINTYNGYTIKLIRDKGPVDSIKDLGGIFSSPWEKKFIPMPAFDPEKKNKDLTLDEIEHELIRPVFNEPRVHAAVNCASMGCPPLRGEAYSAETLDAQLTEQVQNWLADTARNKVTPVNGKIQVSKIFDWFDEDFGKKRPAVIRWIADHVKDESVAKQLRAGAGDLKLKYLSYSWKLNAQKGKR